MSVFAMMHVNARVDPEQINKRMLLTAMGRGVSARECFERDHKALPTTGVREVDPPGSFPAIQTYVKV